MFKNKIILGIESSCDDTAAAVIKGNKLLSSVIASQDVHKKYGGVVPELASRAHQQNIVPVVWKAINDAGLTFNEIEAIAYTKYPGLVGSLIVGESFAKSLSMAWGLPIYEVNHLDGHIFANFISDSTEKSELPQFPFICLIVSGGHTQIVLVESFSKKTIIGQTIDDAAGEAFDKIGKVIGLKYPAGAEIDALSKLGNPKAFKFTKPKVSELNYSFSGLKTNVMQFLNKQTDKESFIKENLADIAASVQATIIDILLEKLELASVNYNIKTLCLGGGVSANNGLRDALKIICEDKGYNLFLPKKNFTTDNAAMIAITAAALS